MTRLPLPPARALLLALALAGCVGPDFVRPEPPAATAYQPGPPPERTAAAEAGGGGAQRLLAGAEVPAEWWRLFGSADLDRLVTRALDANPTVAAGEAALKAAQAATEAQRGGWWPTLTGSFTSTRTKTAQAVSANTTSTAPVASLHTAQLSLSYAPDVWGGVWRQVEGQEAAEEGQRFQLAAVRLTLAADVVLAAVNEAMLRDQIAAQEEIVAIERDVLAIQRRMAGLGQSAEADAVMQDAALAQAEAALPPLRQQLAVQRDALAALTGATPDQPPAETFTLAGLHLPETVPVSLPARLVERRPDIRQAEAALHAATAAIGVAIADRLPLLNLTIDAGSAASLLTGKDHGYAPAKTALFTPGTGFWGLGAGLSQPLFDGFTLARRQDQAEAEAEQAAALYRATVLAALQSVADALQALQADADTLRAARRAEAAATDSLTIARRQLDLGAVAPLALLTAEQTALQARAARIQAEANRLADTARMLQALGGGWG
ncbi:efflux transporter outer membrane subunit [Phaeospirillum tilakii]|uniref:Efflux transporter outer membrane subunit n=1 Tax=Phaeospirillum tilakii TaxID=741673 RepID=A0ABW5C7R0_9PROT